MCRFTARPSPVSVTENHEEKFTRTEKVLQLICVQMEEVLHNISEVSVRLERAGPLSAAGASLEIQLQVLQGVYSQMHQAARYKAEQLENLSRLI